MRRLPSRVFSQNINQTLLVLLLITFVFLLLFTTKAAQQTGDSLVYAFFAKTGQEIFHPHHLLYTPAVRLFFLALSSICDSCDAIFAGQIHNILWAIVTILSFFLVLRQLWSFTFISLLSAIFLLVTRGFWELSTQTTTYIPVTGCLALLVAVLLVRRQANLTFSKVIIISLLLALSILYHQANVLFCVPLAYYLIATEGRRGWQIGLAVISLAGIIVMATYVLVFLSINGNWSISEFLRFCLGYISEICWSGHCRASPNHWGTFENFGVAGIRSLFDSLLWNFVNSPERFSYVALPTFALSIAILGVWNLRQIVKHAIHEKIRAFLLIWLLTYLLFFFWWLPTYQHPLVITLFPILLLAFLALKDVMDWLCRPFGLSPVMSGTGDLRTKPGGKVVHSNFNRRIAITATIFLIVVISARNFYTRIWPLHQPDSDSYLEASELATLAPQECVFLTSYRVWNHLRYYFDRERTILAKYPLSYFYQSDTLPEQYHFEGEQCLIIEAQYVTPDYTLRDYAISGSNGYSDPSKWLVYMEWLFDLEYDSNDTLVASRQFEVITLDEGGPYIFLSSFKTEVDGLNGLFQRLDNQINGRLGEEANPFQSWLSTAYSGF